MGVRHKKVPLHAHSGHASLPPHRIRELCCGAPKEWSAHHFFARVNVVRVNAAPASWPWERRLPAGLGCHG